MSIRLTTRCDIHLLRSLGLLVLVANLSCGCAKPTPVREEPEPEVIGLGKETPPKARRPRFPSGLEGFGAHHRAFAGTNAVTLRLSVTSKSSRKTLTEADVAKEINHILRLAGIERTDQGPILEVAVYAEGRVALYQGGEDETGGHAVADVTLNLAGVESLHERVETEIKPPLVLMVHLSYNGPLRAAGDAAAIAIVSIILRADPDRFFTIQDNLQREYLESNSMFDRVDWFNGRLTVNVWNAPGSHRVREAMKPNGRLALPLCLEAMRDESCYVRCEAIEALSGLLKSDALIVDEVAADELAELLPSLLRDKCMPIRGQCAQLTNTLAASRINDPRWRLLNEQALQQLNSKSAPPEGN